jgi:hypothetical protein
MANLKVIVCHRVCRELFFLFSGIRILMLICEPWGTSFPVLLMVDILMHDPRTVGLRWYVWVSGKLKLNQERFHGVFFLDFISRLQGLRCQLVFGRLWSLWRDRRNSPLLWDNVIVLLWSIFSAKWFWLKNFGCTSLKNLWTFNRFVCYGNAGSSRRILAWPRLPISALVGNYISAMTHAFVSGKLLNFSHQSSILNNIVLVTLWVWLTELFSKSPVLFQVVVKSWSWSIIGSDVR